MTRKIISLNDFNWRVSSVAQKPFADVNDLADATDWLPAQVPGDVRLDLLRAGKISDPFYADNNEASQWIDSRDWWYVRDVDLQLQEGERAFLIFDGIDYQSAVFWNGDTASQENGNATTRLKQLGRHAGMFSQQIYELPTEDERPKTEKMLSVVSQQSTVAVRIWGSDALPRLNLTLAQKFWARIIQPLYRPPEHPFPDRYATLKCQMQFGWDFAPRLRTCGIWDDASIVVVQSVLIEDAQIKSTVYSQQSTVANVTVALTLDSGREQSVRVMCNVRGKNFSADPQTFTFDLHLMRGEQVREVSFDLIDTQLWNPWDRGAPNLYEMQVVIARSEATKQHLHRTWLWRSSATVMQVSPDSAMEIASQKTLAMTESLDSLTVTFGIRSFELASSPTSQEPWQFVINGEREFLRGANWVPMNAIPARLTDADYTMRLQQARDANVNFLRVWGGGLREKRAFYDLCDELGILVWQEFPFAGAFLDRFPTDRAHMQLIQNECGGIVRTLRNHPSLVVWCGGNEFNTRGNQAIVKQLRAVVDDNDSTRPFKPASPYRNESHNWRVWHRFANLRDYRADRTPFLSEFGLQSLPNIESLKKFLPDNALQSPHKLWEYHNADLKKLGRYAQPVILSGAKNLCAENGETLRSAQGDKTDVTTFVDATQRAQAFGLQIAIEHIRRQKPRTIGVAVWQFNDCWQSISWSVVDYYGTPKRAYEEMKRLYSPVFASFNYPLVPRRAGDTVRGNVWLINDLREPFDNVELRAELSGKEIYAHRFDIAPNSSERVDSLTVTLGNGENILRFLMRDGERVLSDHAYDLNLCDVGEIGLIDKLMIEIGKRLMR